MGLLQVAAGAVGGVLADQWREYFYCDALPEDVLMRKGEKRQGRRNFNTKGSDNIISNGSIIAVNEGQCMIIVDQGAIAEVCAQAGEFVYDTSTEPSIFYGGLGQGIAKSFETWKRRVTMGGDTGKDQRVYFFNTKDIIGNKYGTANPVPVLIVDNAIGFHFEGGIRCFGEYSYKIVDPILFYKKFAGNEPNEYRRDRIDSQLKSELLTALQPALYKVSEAGVRYSAFPGHTKEIADALNEELSSTWGAEYGIVVSRFGVSSVSMTEEDEKRLKDMQSAAALSNPMMGAGFSTLSYGTAAQDAAKNPNGSMMGFAGIGMAQNMGANVAGQAYQVGAQMGYQPVGGMGQPMGGMAQQPMGGMGQQQMGGMGQQQMVPPTQAAGWTCSCGKTGNTGKFCAECGQPKPEDPGFWTCSCGAKNKGRFCSECGQPKPAGVPQYKCDKCGWEPEDPTKPPKFCPNCGDPFGDEDVVK